MDARQAETLYLKGRVSDSLAMAVAAAGPCAQIAHLTLARLYGEAIDTLIAQSPRSFHSPYLDAPVVECVVRDHLSAATTAEP